MTSNIDLWMARNKAESRDFDVMGPDNTDDSLWGRINDNYEISIHGDVRSKKTGKLLDIFVNDKGYKACKLSKTFIILIHMFVAKNFVDNPHDDKSVVHLNYNKLDNTTSNLMWCGFGDFLNWRFRTLKS
jgi:hypothetical protein